MVVPEKINSVVSRGEKAISLKKRWVAGYRLVQEIDRLQQVCNVIRAETRVQGNGLGLGVKIECGNVRRRGALDRALFTR